MQRLKILHRTYYNFSGAVQLGVHRLLLRPREGHDLQIESSRLDITPPASVRWTRDEYDNSVATATFDVTATQLAIVSEVIVHQYHDAPLDFYLDASAVNHPFIYDAESAVALRPYFGSMVGASHNPPLWNWLSQVHRIGQTIPTYELLQRLMLSIQRSFSYQVREAAGVRSSAETLSLGSGSCRDFAALFIESAHLLGIAARFVTGYLNTPTSQLDFGATHAWAEVYLPGAGWIGFDPTIGELASNKHVAVAVGRLPQALSPVTGSFFGAPGTNMDVGVWVTDVTP